MAVAGAQITVEFPELEKLREGIRSLGDKAAAAELLGDALYKAVYPAFLRLGEVTPIGPTRNLRRAASIKVKTYPRNGGAVALIGYQRAGAGASRSAQGGTVEAGPDRAFHQWWLEFGTKDRVVSKFSNKPYQRKSPTTPFKRIRMGREETVRGKGVVHWVSGQNAYIASSFNRLGPFKFVRSQSDRKSVQTDPAYPKAFFKKSKTPITINAVEPGGVAGLPPVQTAWNQTKGQVAERLTRELQISLEAAVRALTFTDTGSITGALTAAG
jgi:hypothetical protein